MLLSLILTPIFLFVNFVIGVLPAFTLPTGAVDAITSIFSMIAGVGYFVPLPQLVIALTILIAFHFGRFVSYGASWLFRKIPGLG